MTKFLHMKGTTKLLLINPQAIVSVELSHRGEVREVKEFILPDERPFDSCNVQVDKNGQIYRLSHSFNLNVEDLHISAVTIIENGLKQTNNMTK